MNTKIEKTINVYKLVKPEHLQKTVPSGYSHKTIERSVLELQEEGLTEEEAIKWLDENKSDFQGDQFVLLPVYNVRFDYDS